MTTFTSRAILNRRAVDRNGVTLFEFAKQVLNGDVVISSEDHLLSVPPLMQDNSLPDWVHIRRQVDAHLDGMGFGATTDEDWGSVTTFADAVLTADVAQVYSTVQAAMLDAPLADQAVQSAAPTVDSIV